MNEEIINRRFKEFREWCLTHVYSEPDSTLHTNLINSVTATVMEKYPPTGKLLDVGCGSGYAMARLKELGCTAELSGLTLSADDAEAARNRGFEVVEQDMSFTDFEDNSFDYLWVRHALEHSPYPLLTLLEFKRIMKPGAKAYIEMPSPKCDRLLEEYDNHYSIMGIRQWTELMKRAGFSILDKGEIEFGVTAKNTDWIGKEVYEFYFLEKEVVQST